MSSPSATPADPLVSESLTSASAQYASETQETAPAWLKWVEMVVAWIPSVVSAGLVCLVAYYKSAASYGREFRYDGDAHQHNFWAQKAWAADLMGVDPIARFYASDAMSPMGYRWLLQAMGRLGEMQHVSETVMIGLMLATGWMLYILGRRAAGSPWGGFILVACIMWYAIFYKRR